MDLEAAAAIGVHQHGAYGRMLYLRRIDDVLDLRVDDPVLVLEERRQVAAGDVAILVDCRRDDAAAVLFGPRRIVGAAPDERDAKRCARDDHGGGSPRSLRFSRIAAIASTFLRCAAPKRFSTRSK